MFRSITTLGFVTALALFVGASSGCRPSTAPTIVPPAATPPVGRISVTPEVIANIGVTFETAERAPLATWLRVPGRLEVPEDQRWTVRSPADGRVTVWVEPWAEVAEGDRLATIESPTLRATQQAIVIAQKSLETVASESKAAAERLRESEMVLRDARAFEADAKARMERLDEIAGGEALSTSERLAAHEAHVEACQRSLQAAVSRDDLRRRSRSLAVEAENASLAIEEKLDQLTVLSGLSRDRLTEEIDTPDGRRPRWTTVSTIDLRAPSRGTAIAVHVANGEHVGDSDRILDLFDVSSLVFRGQTPETDWRALRPGARVRIELPGGDEFETALSAVLPVLDETSRAVRVQAAVPSSAGALPHGLSATAFVVTDESDTEEVLIPEGSVVFDGLDAITFRRDPDDPTTVIRTPVELGARSGGRVVVHAGLLDGDEVVLQGVHQLRELLKQRGPKPKGHMHADGTWHEGDH